MQDAAKRGLALLGYDPEPDPIFVMRPTLPDLASYHDVLKGIWASRWLTNCGSLHAELERGLADHLKVEHLSLVSNGTLAILLALRAMGLRSGSVVTTPFTFPATTHCIEWLNATPIFADVDLNTGNIDPASVAERIQPDTCAILAVHVYGTPCNHAALKSIAEQHGLALIYDGAHAFGVEVDGKSILDWGDATTLSFHVTKLFSTIEGGAVIVPSAERKQQIDRLRNFGIVDEETVSDSGLNAKMNELQAAYGLLRLQDIEGEIAARRRVAETYDRLLDGVGGIKIITKATDSFRNFSYYAIRILPDEAGIDRDDVYAVMKGQNIFLRKYFHPLTAACHAYSGLETATRTALPNAFRLDREVLCLPMYGALPLETAERIARLLRRIIELGLSANGTSVRSRASRP